MRRLRLILLASSLAFGTACKQAKRASLIANEDAGTTVSTVYAADAKAAPQLRTGFHSVEENSWRWTMGRFAATLRRPAGSADKGATLVVAFALPDAVLERVKETTLSASVEGVAIPAETYTAAGSHVYRKDVPASALTQENVNVEFALDKFVKAGEIDARELGVIVTSIGLEAK